MKYIKTFESNQKYKKGDYVLLKDEALNRHNELLKLYFDDNLMGYAKIKKDIHYDCEIKTSSFLVQDNRLHINYNDIERKLTPEEIKKMEIIYTNYIY